MNSGLFPIPRPRVVLCADVSTSSSKALPAAVKSYVAAVPEPVNCIPLSEAEVRPEIASKSASYACTEEPIFVLRRILVVSDNCVDDMLPILEGTSALLFSLPAVASASVAISIIPSIVVVARETPPLTDF